MAQVVNLDDFSAPPLPSARRSNDVERRIEKEGKEGREDKGQGGDGPSVSILAWGPSCLNPAQLVPLRQ